MPTVTDRPETDAKPTAIRPPVRDMDGYEVRLVRVTPGERTCLRCGEIVYAEETGCSVCQDLTVTTGINNETLVPTISYLREGEYVIVGASHG